MFQRILLLDFGISVILQSCFFLSSLINQVLFIDFCNYDKKDINSVEVLMLKFFFVVFFKLQVGDVCNCIELLDDELSDDSFKIVYDEMELGIFCEKEINL